jgi:hypothetical protein
MSRIDDLLESQAAALAALQDDTAAAILRLAADARREMREALEAALADGLDAATPYTVQHLRTMLAQAEAIVANLERRIGKELDATARTAGEQAFADLLDVIRANEPDFLDTGGRVEMRVLSRLTVERGLLVHQYSTKLYSAEVMAAIQRDLAAGLLTGGNRKAVVDRIVKSGTGTMAAKEHRAELIARMESNRLYNDMHMASLEEAASVLDEPGTDDPLLRQMSEYFDSRNSPASRAADGIVAALTEPFRIPVADIREWERKLKRKAGIVGDKKGGGTQVPIVGAYYELARYPLHYGERGRQIPYRPSWDNGAALAKMSARQRKGIPARA